MSAPCPECCTWHRTGAPPFLSCGPLVWTNPTLSADPSVEIERLRGEVVRLQAEIADGEAAFEDMKEAIQKTDAFAQREVRRIEGAAEHLRTWQRQAGPGHPLGKAVRDALTALGKDPNDL